jgi:hypothetical protein
MRQEIRRNVAVRTSALSLGIPQECPDGSSVFGGSAAEFIELRDTLLSRERLRGRIYGLHAWQEED